MTSSVRPFNPETDAEEDVFLSSIILPEAHDAQDASTFSVYVNKTSTKRQLHKAAPRCVVKGVDNAKLVQMTVLENAGALDAPGKWGFVVLPTSEADTPRLALVVCISPRRREMWCLAYDAATARWTYERPNEREQTWLKVNGYAGSSKVTRGGAGGKDTDSDDESDSDDDDDGFSQCSFSENESYEALRDLVFDVQCFVNVMYGDVKYGTSLSDMWMPALSPDPLQFEFVGPEDSTAAIAASNEKQLTMLRTAPVGNVRISDPVVQLNTDGTFVYDLDLPGQPRAGLTLTTVQNQTCVTPRTRGATQQIWCMFFHNKERVRFSYDLRALILACTRAG